MKTHRRIDRRRFLQASSAIVGTAVWTGTSSRALGFRSPNDRPKVGVVGCGSRWDQRATLANGPHGLGKEFPKFSDIIMVCDVHADRVERAKALVKDWLGSEPVGTGDYRQAIDNPEIDVVHIVTPDHWHAKVAIEAMLSGKDVYCEKPMTLTIEEGRLICDVQKKTGSVFQVGTQQRSQSQMVKAVAMIRDGRLGDLTHVSCGIGGAPTSPELPVAEPPTGLDWDRWLGPAPWTEYRALPGGPNEMKSWSRAHYEFRWWYEYSGGKLTDWGAHHVDIATWGMGKTDTGPILVDPIMVKHPVPFEGGYPTVMDRYNTATAFNIKATYEDGVELSIHHDRDNGILFEGTEGRLFVNRGRLTGVPVDELASNPLPEGALEEVYKGRSLTSHLANFFDAVAARKEPVSDPHSHHRGLSTCHLAGIAARLGRRIKWDPKAERILDDDEANAFVAREKRSEYELEM
jgi:predicted dehydrogenase